MSRLSSALLALLVLGAAAWLGYALLADAVPPVDDLAARVHGRLAERGAPYTHLDQIPATVQEATIVTEDARFASNTGVDPRGVLRAIVDNAVRRCLCEGGSTISQQLAKQIYLQGDDASVRRKLSTIILALQIDQRFSKNEILEFYLNTAYYGHGAYGVGAAAAVYWRRPVTQVDLAQAAMLAGLLQAPSDYDPIAHPNAARQRRGQVLTRLLDTGMITAAQLQLAASQPVATAPLSGSGTNPGTQTS